MDPRGMVSQPSLGFAKWVSLTWKYLLGRDSLFCLFFQSVFCCNIQGSYWARCFSGEGLNYTHSLPLTVKGRLLMSSYTCIHTPTKNGFIKWSSHSDTVKTLHQDHFCHCLPSLSLIHALRPDSLVCKHTGSVTRENVPNLSNMSSVPPAPNQIERSFMYQSIHKRLFFRTHKPVCHFLLIIPIIPANSCGWAGKEIAF